MRVTGERIVTKEGGFNASWQRHTACYQLSAGLIGPGPVLDAGCGAGHAYGCLAPRVSVGVDLDHASLVQQDRMSVLADMRSLPFPERSFGSVLSVHSIEHVPDPERAVAESARVLAAGGTAIFVTPNRLTFGLPDEIIDPYHYLEFDPRQLESLVAPFFGRVEVLGLFGSERYMQFYAEERRKLHALLAKDPLRLRRLVPRKIRQKLYDWKLTRERVGQAGTASELSVQDFFLRPDHLDEALDLFACCTAK